ncbi:MAG: glycosyltransferase [Micrococcales bacterium]|nr:glycosyltransferase [Micrococcales bacterium]
MTAADLTEPEATTTLGSAPADVTAVLVTAGVTPYLERTLHALAAQTRRPAHVLLVDVGGPAGAPALLDDAFLTVAGVRTARTRVSATSFGAAVSVGLARLAGAGQAPTTWLWLLHDDSAPAPDALAELVRAVGQATSVAVAGAKQRTWTEPERLVEVGLTTTRSGRRVSAVVPGELDQGQHDGATDVLGVGIAGALVRRDVWQGLGGTDPALGPFGDGLDLSRRARLAGHRVVVVPQAVVRHAQASYHGLRVAPEAGDPRRSFAARRRSQVHARLVAAPWWVLPLVMVAALLAAPVRALGRLVGSQPDRASAELAGGWGALVRPRAVLAARRRLARASVLPRRALRPLQATWRQVWDQSADRRRRARRKDAPQVAERTRLERARQAARRRAVLAGLLVGLSALTVAALGSLVAPVLSGARLAGGALAFAPSTWAQTWSAATSDWVFGGLGQPGVGEPLVRVLAVLSVPVGGDVGVVVAGLLLGGVVAAGWGAWVAAGAATRSLALRVWAALVWALAPSLLVAVGSGRVGAVLVHVLAPWAAFGLVRAARGSGAALAATSLVLAAVCAGAPSLVLPCLVVLVVLALATGRVRLLLAAVPGLVLLGPLLVDAARRGADGWYQLLADPGLAQVADPAGPVQRLLGVPTQAVEIMVPPWVPTALAGGWPGLSGAVVLVVAVVGLVVGGRAARLAWVVAALGLLWATVLVALPATHAAGQVGTVFLGPSVALAHLGFLAAALVGADRAVARWSERRSGWRQPLVAGLVAFAVSLAGLGAASWVWQARGGEGVQVRAVTGPVVPAVGQQAFPQGSRVLMVLAGHDVVPHDAVSRDAEPTRYRLLGADGVQMAEVRDGATAAVRDDATRELETTVAALVTGSSADVSAALGALGVAYVQVPSLPEASSPTGAQARARAELLGRLDATPGLERVTDQRVGTLWRVATPALADHPVVTGWARLVTADVAAPAETTVLPSDGRSVATTVDPADADRTLVLAERSGARWGAWLDGERLDAAAVGWRQGFTVPAGASGRLVVHGADQASSLWLGVQAAVGAVALVAAVPLRRRVHR